MTSGFKSIFADLEDAAKTLNPSKGQTLYTVKTKSSGWASRRTSRTPRRQTHRRDAVEIVDRDGAWLE